MEYQLKIAKDLDRNLEKGNELIIDSTNQYYDLFSSPLTPFKNLSEPKLMNYIKLQYVIGLSNYLHIQQVKRRVLIRNINQRNSLRIQYEIGLSNYTPIVGKKAGINSELKLEKCNGPGKNQRSALRIQYEIVLSNYTHTAGRYSGLAILSKVQLPASFSQAASSNIV